MKKNMHRFLVVFILIFCTYISAVIADATTWHSFSVSWNVTIGTGSGRVTGRDRIVVGDTVKFSGTRNVTDLGEALLTIDRFGAQGYWQDGGATTVYQKSGVVKGDASDWAMTDNTAFSTTTPGSNYYPEKVLITKRHYTGATTYEDTEVVYYNTPTPSPWISSWTASSLSMVT